MKNLSIVMSGTAIAQIIGFALTPVISRLFEPKDFGVFGSFSSVLGVAAAGVTLQYSQALMLPKNEEDAANVFAVSILSVIIISILGLLVVYVFSEWMLQLLNVSETTWLLWFLPLGIFVSGINQSFQAWCVRRKAFKKTASSQLIRSGCINILQIVTGAFGAGSGGLIASTVAGDACASNSLARQIIDDKELFKDSLRWKQILMHAKEYRDFPIYSATQNVMNALSQGLPVLLMAYFYGVTIAGAYAFGIRILKVPMNFVLTALRQVLFQKISETFNNKGELKPLFVKSTLGLFCVAFVPSMILFIWAPNIFAWLFGPEWFTAGIFAGWLVLWLVPLFSNVPSVLFARILRQQRKLFIFEIVILISRVTVLVLGGYYLSSLNTVILFSAVGFLLNIMVIIWVVRLLIRTERNAI